MSKEEEGREREKAESASAPRKRESRRRIRKPGHDNAVTREKPSTRIEGKNDGLETTVGICKKPVVISARKKKSWDVKGFETSFIFCSAFWYKQNAQIFGDG